nr:hypothetical protein [Aurantimonas coralicida]
MRRFQARHGLADDGVAAEHTYKAMYVPANIRLSQLQTNIGCVQSMQVSPARYVMDNIPAAAIEAVENGQVVQRHTAVVGVIGSASSHEAFGLRAITRGPSMSSISKPSSRACRIKAMQSMSEALYCRRLPLVRAGGDQVNILIEPYRRDLHAAAL